VVRHQALELLAQVLAAAIRMMQQRLGLAPPPDRHHQRVSNEPGRHGRAHRPANHPAREQVEHRCHIQPAFRRPDVREVSDPFAFGCGCLEGGAACVWRKRSIASLHCGRGVWDARPVDPELLVQADRFVGGSDAVLVIDDTAIPKKGAHSVGVAAQYASVLGKTANCQTLVSLALRQAKYRSC
jgi:hypothetical protein